MPDGARPASGRVEGDGVVRGDRLVRGWSDAVRAALAATAVLLVLVGRPTAAIGVVFITVTAVATRLARAPAPVECAFVTLLATDVWLTSSGAMAHIDRHDTVGHLVLTAAVAPVLASGMRTLGWTESASPRDTGALAALATIALAVGWELLEWTSDILAGTNMSLSALDTAYDLTSGVVGAIVGGLLAAYLRRA